MNNPDPIVYRKLIELPPGNYKIHVEVKDLTSGATGTHDERIIVPDYNAESLSHSSLVLADRWGKAKTKPKSSAHIIIGNQRVRPSISRSFRTNQRMGVFMQIYNLEPDSNTRKPRASITYIISQGGLPVFSHTETTADIETNGEVLTLEKSVPLAQVVPGNYTLTVKITDLVRNQTIEPQTSFTVVKR